MKEARSQPLGWPVELRWNEYCFLCGSTNEFFPLARTFPKSAYGGPQDFGPEATVRFEEHY